MSSSTNGRNVVCLLARSKRSKRRCQTPPFQRPPPLVQLSDELKLTTAEALELFRSPQGNNFSPAIDRDSGNIDRSSNGAASFVVGEHGGLQHVATVTPINNFPQLAGYRKSLVVTLVTMNNNTLALRLSLALKRARMSPTDLAQECEVSSVAVHKWMSGRTKTLRFDTVQKVSRALKVNAEWLNEGKGAMALDDDSKELYDMEQLVALRDQMLAGAAALDAMIARQRLRESVQYISATALSNATKKKTG